MGIKQSKKKKEKKERKRILEEINVIKRKEDLATK